MSGAMRAAVPGGAGGGQESVLMVLAANYRDLDIDGAGKLHEVSLQIAQDLAALEGPIAGCVVLSTCNRFEIYCEVSSAAHLDQARMDALGSVGRRTDSALAAPHAMFDARHGPDVAEHLFAVGSGLDSLVVGEREVAGQLRRSLAAAQAAGTATGRLTRLFQAAARTARELAAQVRLGDAGSSAAAVALDLAWKALLPVPLAAGPALIIGSGIYASTVVGLLRKQGCPDISVYSRSGRAKEFAAARNVAAIGTDELPAALSSAQLLVGCSGTGSRLSLSTVAAARQDSSGTLVAADLAPTHDFDPRIAGLPGVELITLDSVRQAAPPANVLAVQRARALVRQAAADFAEQEAARILDPAIVALRRHVQHILETELARIRKAHGCTGPAEEAAAAMQRVANRLLHVPAVRARELAAAGRHEDYAAALEALFGITPDASGQKDGWEHSATA